MDPLSLTASIIAVTTVAVEVGKVLASLHEDWESLPGRVHALNNEIQDFRVVLNQVSIAVQERKLTSLDGHGDSTLPAVLGRGEQTLLEIKVVLDKIIASSGSRKRDAIQRVLLWRKEQGRFAILQEVIKEAKSSLNVILGASNSFKISGPATGRDEPIVPSSFIEAILQEQNNTFTQSLSQRYSQVDERLDRVEALIRAQSTAMHASQREQIGPLYSAVAPLARRNAPRAISPASVTRIRRNSTSVRVRLRQAHASVIQAAPAPATPSGARGLHPSWIISSCLRRKFWSISSTEHPSAGIGFFTGLASPRDVSTTRVYSLLRWALYGQQYETCKFLMLSGADPTYRPIAKSDDSPSDKAGDVILRGSLSEEATEILRIIAEGSDYIERQNFSKLHKIVLGICPGDLENTILEQPQIVDFPDATGRTPLQWAAARGDERAVITLLSWDADPNNMDDKFNTPLTLAANQNKAVCVRLLLEAGAYPDPELPPGTKFGTPLNCAARNASDPMVMKSLLDFNADIEATGVDGITPLLHVARGSSAAHAMLLLEYGANINACSKAMQSPLTAAIQYNNHAVLKLLLERWSEYQQCPRLRGPNLLDIVAQYADVKTIQLLTTAEHLRARSDKLYLRDHYSSIMDSRPDSSEKLETAFEDLLSVLRTDVASQGDLTRRMEEGVLHAFSDEDSDSSVFEDAKENME
ncbi:hypothetical protein PWT90_02172 [Aphanocladium album]|nr:hypothetical protein PWT90_02172 [Aphanocladium album]